VKCCSRLSVARQESAPAGGYEMKLFWPSGKRI
jgi:hypothetical protein